MKTGNIIVSITCLTYNHAPYISRCLDGFINQVTDFPFEILIHDDASIDGTSNIIREYETKYPDIINPIYQIDNQYSRGVDVFSNNVSRAKGKYIALCEGDDYWIDPYKLQKQVDLLEAEEHDGIVAVATNCSVSDLNGNVIKKERLVIPPVNEEGVYTLHDFLKNSHQYPTLTVVFRNRDMNFILENMKKLSNPFLGDWILWVLLYQQGSFYFMNQVTASYRINPNSITHTVNAVKRWEEDFVIRRKLIELLPIEYHKYLNDDTYAYFMIGMAYRKGHNYFKFLLFSIRAFFSNPLRCLSLVKRTLLKK